MDPRAEYDALGRRYLRPVMGDVVTLVGAIPGLAAQFDRVVPSRFIERVHPLINGVPDLSVVEDEVVACPCGGRASLLGRLGRITACPAGCDRFYLLTEDEVRVASYEAEVAAA